MKFNFRLGKFNGVIIKLSYTELTIIKNISEDLMSSKNNKINQQDLKSVISGLMFWPNSE